MDQKLVAHLCNGILFSYQKDKHIICSNMNEKLKINKLTMELKQTAKEGEGGELKSER